MNNIVTNWSQIVKFGENYGWPEGKERGKLREYLQSLLVLKLYQLPQSKSLSFVGGTSLRLLRNIGRFSEDLDFDVLDPNLSHSEIDDLINSIVNSLKRENIQVELTTTHKSEKNYYNIKFSHLLSDLGISTNQKEKLSIKFDYTYNWKNPQTETLVFNRFGGIEQVITNSLDDILVQKLAAYVYRPQTQPRDMFDIVWLHAQLAKYDQEFAKANGYEDLLFLAQKKFQSEGVTERMKRRLRPFLFNEQDVDKIELLGEVIKTTAEVGKS